MEKKKWIHYTWQTLLLCMFVSLSHPVSAKTLPSSVTPNKDHARKPKTAKSKPVRSIATDRATSPHTKKPPLQKTPHEPAQKKLLVPRESAAHAPLTKENKRKAVTPSLPITQRPARLLEKKNDPNAHRTKRRYITVLKETSRKTMEKTVVVLPETRTAKQKQRKTEATRITAQKSPNRTVHKELQVVAPVPILTPQTQVVSPVVAPALTPSPPSQAVVRTPELAPIIPVAPVLAATPVVSSASPPQNKTEPTPVVIPPLIGTSAPPPPRPTATTSPLSSSQVNLITFVQQNHSANLLKDEKRAKESSGYTPQKAPFTVTVNEEPQGYRINSVFVLPGDEVYVAVFDAQKKAAYTVQSSLGPERLLATRRWRWTAPTTTGVYPVKIINRRTNATLTLNVFVMAPLDRVEDGYLNGYRIGTYPTEPLRQLAMYTRPRGLIEVTEENENIFVSPHFRLRQFLCKQEGTFPKYMILDARLLATLEQLLEMVNAHGYRARTFTVMSGYRTPYYNRAIGNRTTYSRHLWGDAADIFIDEEPRDGKMDDLNQDGVIDAHDADVIYQLIENAPEPRIQKIMMGGLARYRETSSHGPFIHVDARGSYVRWGLKTLTRGGTASTAGTAFQQNNKSRTQPSYSGQPSPSDPTP